MIDFACKQFDINQVIKCGLGLTKSDLKVLELLLKNSADSFTTEDIAKELNLDLSTVQRAVKKLHEKDVIERHQQNFDVGGYAFIYEIKNKNHVRQVISDIIQGWSDKVKSELKRL